MERTTRIAMVALALSVTACASEPERPQPPEGHFATYIEEDGTRKFQYTIDMEGFGQKSGKGRPGNMRGHVSGSSGRGMSGGVTGGSSGRGGPPGSSGGDTRFQRINTLLENRLEQSLKESDFCPEGHRETERMVEPDMAYIRGECTAKTAGDADPQ